ncbi:MAG: histidine kinase N-terminal 7TM domain-containing protein [Eubacteriales bacterium]
MEVTDKLALEFNTIILSHVLTLLVLFSFSLYVYFRAKKNVLLYSYLVLVGSIALWLISKIFKTVSPVIGLRWFFIVTQYFAIDFLGPCLLVFAYVYLKNKLPPRGSLVLWLILPAVSFIALLTNPMHMSFYSYFDIYKDRFGSMFYISQSVQYIYLIVGCIMLSQGYTRQPGFRGKRSIGRLFSVLVLLPLMGNLYYILFKLDVFPWVFPFPVFDFSPIAAFVSLMLFMIPVLAFRFFDISPISLERLYDLIPNGIIFVDKGQSLYGANRSFLELMLPDGDAKAPENAEELINACAASDKDNATALRDFITRGGQGETELSLRGGRIVRLTKRTTKNGHLMLCLNDITQISRNRGELREQNRELERVNRLLDSMRRKRPTACGSSHKGADGTKCPRHIGTQPHRGYRNSRACVPRHSAAGARKA